MPKTPLPEAEEGQFRECLEPLTMDKQSESQQTPPLCVVQGTISASFNFQLFGPRF